MGVQGTWSVGTLFQQKAIILPEKAWELLGLGWPLAEWAALLRGKTPVPSEAWPCGHSLILTLRAPATPKLFRGKTKNKKPTGVRAQHIYQTLPQMGDPNLRESECIFRIRQYMALVWHFSELAFVFTHSFASNQAPSSKTHDLQAQK